MVTWVLGRVANLEITQSGNNVGLLVAGGGYNYTAKFESSDAEANIIIEDSNSTNDGNMIGVATNDMYFITDTAERIRITPAATWVLDEFAGLQIRQDFAYWNMLVWLQGALEAPNCYRQQHCGQMHRHLRSIALRQDSMQFGVHDVAM
jgi:hypothetical protein